MGDRYDALVLNANNLQELAMKYVSAVTSLLLVSTLTLAGCGGNDSTAEDPTTGDSTTTETPTETPAGEAPTADAPAGDTPAETPTAEAPDTPAAEAPAGSQVYEEPNGLFEVAFPSGYEFQETGSGVVFVSADDQFGGSIDFGPAQGQQLTDEQLETGLKQEYETRLTEVEWQGTEVQPDGSLRLDWIGTDPQGNVLDSVSFVEQRGDNIFILNLHGINAQYANYNTDAQTIVNAYRINE